MQKRILRIALTDVTAACAHQFLREVEVAANPRHPHILPLFDSGEAGGVQPT